METPDEQSLNPGWKAWAVWVVKVLLSLLLLWMAFRKVPLASLGTALRNAHLGWFTLSLAWFLLGVSLFEPQRYQAVAHLLGRKVKGPKAWIRMFLESRVFVYMLPSSLGQEGYLWWSLRRERWTHRQCLAWIGILRATGMALWVAALAWALRDGPFRQATQVLLPGPLSLPWLWLGLSAALLALVVILFLLSRERIPVGTAEHLGQWIWVTLSTLGTAVTCVISLVLAARAFGVSITLAQGAGFQTLLFLAMVLPISVAGIGLQEGLLLLLAPGLGFSASAALGISLALHLQRVLPALIGVASMLVRRWDKEDPNRPMGGQAGCVIAE